MCELTQEYLAQLLNEEYKIWKKHVPFLYSVMGNYELTTNSNTVSWLRQPSVITEDGIASEVRIVLGTNSNTDKNCLIVAKIVLPTNDTVCDMTQYKMDAQVGELGLKRLQVEDVIPQNSEVLRIKANPIKSTLIASKTGGYDPHLNIYELSENGSGKQRLQEPLLRLQGHTAEGYGLDWNHINSNLLISGSLDRKICIWNIQSGDKDSKLKPFSEYHFHSTGVEDVNWNKINPDIFASCGQDRLIAIWDMRQRKKKPECQKTGHTGEVYTLDFSPDSQVLFLSGGEDGEIGLWDMRNVTKRVHTFAGHSDSINKLSWCPTKRLLFASASSDRRAIVWDIAKCGDSNQYEQPAQVAFIHAGHRSRVLDIDWSFDGEILSSTEESGNIQVWKMSSSTQQPLPTMTE